DSIHHCRSSFACIVREINAVHVLWVLSAWFLSHTRFRVLSLAGRIAAVMASAFPMKDDRAQMVRVPLFMILVASRRRSLTLSLGTERVISLVLMLNPRCCNFCVGSRCDLLCLTKNPISSSLSMTICVCCLESCSVLATISKSSRYAEIRMPLRRAHLRIGLRIFVKT